MIWITLSKPLVTPFLTTDFTQLTTAKVFTPKGGTPDPAERPNYTVKCILNPDDPTHAEFIQRVEGAWEELEEQIKAKIGKPRIKLAVPHLPIREVEDDEGLPTGLLHMKAGRKAEGTSKRGDWAFVLPIVDTQKSVVDPKEGELSRGSIVRLSVIPRAYESAGAYGMVLDLSAVQVKHAEYFTKDSGAEVFETFNDDEVLETGGNF